MGFLPLLPSCGKSGKRMNYGILATFVQTLGANIWLGVDALKSCRTCARLWERARVNEHVTESIRKTAKAKTVYKLYGERLVARCLTYYAR